MVWNSALKWFVAFLWAGLPVIGWLPGAQVRLTTQWFSVLASLVVIGFSRQAIRNPFRRLMLSGVMLALLHYKQPTVAYLWVAQAVIVLTAAAMFVGSFRELKTAVIVCAWAQIVVMILQKIG